MLSLNAFADMHSHVRKGWESSGAIHQQFVPRSCDAFHSFVGGGGH